MDEEKRKQVISKMNQIGEMVDRNLEEEGQHRERKNMLYYHDFEFKGSRLAVEDVYIVEISIQEKEKTGDKSNKKAENEKELGKNITYEIYDENNELIAIVDENGKIQFSQMYLEEIRGISEEHFQMLQLKDIEFELPRELKKNDLVMTKEDLATYSQRKTENVSKPVKEDDEEKEQQNKIAKLKGIPANNVLRIRENSNFYKDHPELEPNLYFYKGADGTIKAEYIDENGNSQPSKYFESSTTNLRQETINMGDDGNPVVKEVPYQVMKTNGLARTDKDVRDVRIHIDIDTYGYLKISEARQGKNGMWASHDIEIRGREYNSRELNEETSIRTRNADPDKQTNTYEKLEDTGLIQNGVQYDEMYLIQHSEEVIEELIKEGYNKEEAIEIFNYMIGEETLTKEEAKQRVNEKIKERQMPSKEKEIDEEEERTPWGDAEKRRNIY